MTGPDGKDYAHYSSMDALPPEFRTVSIRDTDAKLELSGNVFQGVGTMDYNGTTVGMQISLYIGYDNNQVAYLTPPEPPTTKPFRRAGSTAEWST